MTKWHRWDEVAPNLLDRVIIVCSDGCSSSLALMTHDGPLDGENADLISANFTKGAIWTLLPPNYALAFMERHDDY